MMKQLFITVMAISFALAAAVAMAEDQRFSQEEIGWYLFYNTGPSGTSCNSCHNSGYLLETAAPNALVPGIRQCMQKNSGSKEIDMKSVMALRAFILALHENSSSYSQSPDMLNGFRPGGAEMTGLRPRRQ
jgi:opacity protein-like surface antigen